MSQNLRLRTVAFLAATAAFSTGAFAQSTYTYGYFINANTTGVPDAQMSVVNQASTGNTAPSGNLCANIYVFSTSGSTLQECCSCQVAANALMTFSVNTNLTNNPLSGTLNSGEIKILSSAPASGVCNAASSYTPSGGLGTWITHVKQPATGSFSISEVSFPAGVLFSPTSGTTELSHLQTTCAANQNQGSGFGICTCGLE
jgi:hypothetical protein